MSRRKVSQLDDPVPEEGAAADEQRIWPIARKRREGGIYFGDGAGVENPDLQSHGVRCRFHVAPVGCGNRRFGRIEQHGYPLDRRHQRAQNSSRLVASSAEKKLTPVALPPGRERLVTRPSLIGSSGTRNTMGVVVVAFTAATEAARWPLQ